MNPDKNNKFNINKISEESLKKKIILNKNVPTGISLKDKIAIKIKKPDVSLNKNTISNSNINMLASSQTITKPNLENIKDTKISSNIIVNKLDNNIKKSFSKFDFQRDKKLNEINKDNITLVNSMSKANISSNNINQQDKSTLVNVKQNIKESVPFKELVKFDKVISKNNLTKLSNNYELGKEEYTPVYHNISNNNLNNSKSFSEKMVKEHNINNNTNLQNISNNNKHIKDINNSDKLDIDKDNIIKDLINNEKQESDDDYDNYCGFDNFNNNDKNTNTNIYSDNFNKKGENISIEKIIVDKELSNIRSYQIERLINVHKLIELETVSNNCVYSFHDIESQYIKSVSGENYSKKNEDKSNKNNYENKEINVDCNSLAIDNLVNYNEYLDNNEKVIFDSFSVNKFSKFIDLSNYIESIIQLNINKDNEIKLKDNKEKAKTYLIDAYKDFFISNELKSFLIYTCIINNECSFVNNLIENDIIDITIRDHFDKFYFEFNNIKLISNKIDTCIVSTCLKYFDATNNISYNIFNFLIKYNLSNSTILNLYISISLITDMTIYENNNNDLLIASTEDGTLLIYILSNSSNDMFVNLTKSKENLCKNYLINSKFINEYQFKNNFNYIGDNSNISLIDENNILKLYNNSLSFNKRINNIVLNNLENSFKLILLFDEKIAIISDYENLISACEIEEKFEQNNLYKENIRIIDLKNIHNLAAPMATDVISNNYTYYDYGIIKEFQASSSLSGYLLTSKQLCYIDFNESEVSIKTDVINEEFNCNDNKFEDNYVLNKTKTNAANFKLCKIGISRHVIFVMFKDNTIKGYEEILCNNKQFYLSEFYNGYLELNMSNINLYPSEICVSQVICKDKSNNNLLRCYCIANLFVLNSKGEIAIYDLNQDLDKSIKPKKSISLLGKKIEKEEISIYKLTIFETLLSDYSNIIAINNSKKNISIANILRNFDLNSKIKFKKLGLRDKYFDCEAIENINNKIINKHNQ